MGREKGQEGTLWGGGSRGEARRNKQGSLGSRVMTQGLVWGPGG